MLETAWDHIHSRSLNLFSWNISQLRYKNNKTYGVIVMRHQHHNHHHLNPEIQIACTVKDIHVIELKTSVGSCNHSIIDNVCWSRETAAFGWLVPLITWRKDTNYEIRKNINIFHFCDIANQTLYNTIFILRFHLTVQLIFLLYISQS